MNTKPINTLNGRKPISRELRLTCVLSIRVTDSEFSNIVSKAVALGLRPSWYLRNILLAGSEAVRARPSKAYLETAAKVSLIASGLTRLIRLAEQRTPLPSEIVGMLDSVHGIAREVIQELRGGSQCGP